MATTVGGDRVLILHAQRTEAFEHFGESSVPIAGRTDIREPNLESEYAKKLLDYWIADATRVYAKLDALTLIFITAPVAQYSRDLEALRKARGQVTLLIGQALLAEIWFRVARIANAGFAISTTPSGWTLLGESVAEAATDLAEAAESGLRSLLKIAGWAALAVVAVYATKEG